MVQTSPCRGGFLRCPRATSSFRSPSNLPCLTWTLYTPLICTVLQWKSDLRLKWLTRYSIFFMIFSFVCSEMINNSDPESTSMSHGVPSIIADVWCVRVCDACGGARWLVSYTSSDCVSKFRTFAVVLDPLVPVARSALIISCDTHSRCGRFFCTSDTGHP